MPAMQRMTQAVVYHLQVMVLIAVEIDTKNLALRFWIIGDLYKEA
jgi:hypothetical protein